MKINIAVCDDNRIVLDDETQLIVKVLSEKNIENTVTKFDTPEKLLKSPEIFDIIFLDVEMAGLNGIETAERIKEKNKECLVIFITNYWSYLDNAFAVHAFRYWKKPIEEEKLSMGIDSAVKELNGMRQTITANIRNGDIQIPIKNIMYIYVLNKISRIVTTKGEIYVYDTYKSLCERLSKFECFKETNRGYYVNFAYVVNYTQDKLICSYQDKSYELNISRRKFNEFDRAFKTWLGGK